MNGIKYRSADEMKDSGIEWIGLIPREWQARKLKYLAQCFPSNVDKKSNENEPAVKLCNYTDAYKNDFITANMSFMDATASKSQIVRYGLRQGDIVITKDSESPDDIGIPAYVLESIDKLVCGYHLSIIRTFHIQHSLFFYYHLRSTGIRKYFETRANGITRYALGSDDFNQLFLSVPSYFEQRKIANFLDIKTAQFDSIIAKKEQLIAKLEDAKKSLISEVVTGKVKIVDGQLVPRQPEEMKDSGVEWLGMIPKEWRACSIKHALEKSSNSIRVGPFGSQLKGEDFNGDFAKIYTQKNVIKCDLILGDDFVTKSKYSEMLAFKVSAGDILLTTRGTIGKIARVSHEAVTGIIHPTLIKFRINDSVLDYDLLQMLFNETDFIEKQVQYMSNSTTIPVIYSDTLKNLRIPLIPVEEQHRIVDFLKLKLRFIDVSIKEENVQLDLLKSAKQSLISEAVTGKIDLRDWEIIEQGGAS